MTVHHLARMRQPETACLLRLTEHEVAAHRAVVAAAAVNLAPGARWQADRVAGGQVRRREAVRQSYALRGCSRALLAVQSLP
jgi:hypothetical protein